MFKSTFTIQCNKLFFQQIKKRKKNLMTYIQNRFYQFLKVLCNSEKIKKKRHMKFACEGFLIYFPTMINQTNI